MRNRIMILLFAIGVATTTRGQFLTATPTTGTYPVGQIQISFTIKNPNPGFSIAVEDLQCEDCNFVGCSPSGGTCTGTLTSNSVGTVSGEFQVVNSHGNPVGNEVEFEFLFEPILPVELVSFTGKQKDGVVILSWETASEFNNKEFQLEYLIGDSWETIELLNGSGISTTTKRYSFTTDKVTSGSNYYRLKQVDFNGDYEYSQIVEVYFSDPTDVKVFPNPSSGEAITITAKEGSIISLFSVAGIIYYTPNYTGEIKLSLQKGFYILTTETGNQKTSTKIVVN